MRERVTRKQSAPEQPTRGRADLERLRTMTEEEIERTSPPELRDLPDDFWDHAKVVWPAGKQPISIRVDEDVLEWFRRGGARYQSRMNAVLRSYMMSMQQRSAAKPPAVRRRRLA